MLNGRKRLEEANGKREKKVRKINLRKKRKKRKKKEDEKEIWAEPSEEMRGWIPDAPPPPPQSFAGFYSLAERAGPG